MKAVVFRGRKKVSVEDVPMPKIQAPTDVILKVTSTAICGSDLHLYNGYNPAMKKGDILGHEFMGVVVEKGKSVKKLKIGDKVIVPFPISCGKCFYCKKELPSLCDLSNPKKKLQEKAYGTSGAAIYGYSELYGGIQGGQAEYVRVLYADHNAFVVPKGIADEKLLFLTDIFPTGYMAAEYAMEGESIETVAVFGCGPVGQFAIRSAFILGAKRVIAIDKEPERLAMAREAGAETVNFDKEEHLVEKLKRMTDGRGPDAVIDAVGLEAVGHGFGAAYDKAKQTVRLQTDRPTALRQVIQSCRKGGNVSIVGVYAGVVDKFPIGSAFGKGLHMHMGQAQVHKYLDTLFDLIKKGKIDPSFVVTHVLPLEEAPEAYQMFNDKEDDCIKVVLKPQEAAEA
jgi:threonine dehydrogenase-like Zn-dependent dehydrogenase